MDATVRALVTNLSNGEADVTEIASIYVDVLAQLATFPILCEYVTSLQPQSGTMSLPGHAVSFLFTFYNKVQLGELSIREANWLLPDWRETVGTPYNFVRESVGAQQVQLIPQPNDNNNGQVINTYTTDNLPVWLQLPVALLVLADEYQRESPHQKLEISQACRSLANLLLAILTGQLKNAIQ